ncbi:MAG: hypothetical protein U1E39_15040 [Planctomycetota bacterium]
MSHDVRVHIRLGTLRLAYEGSRAFYETAVEPLVARAADRGRRTPAAAAAPASPPAPASAAPDVAPAPAAAAPTPAAFVPRSPEFGRFLRRLGPEAAEPDRRVVALAFYLWNYERLETFTEREIAGCFAALGLRVPGDLDAILDDLTDRKRFVESLGAGLFKLTKKGENYVKTRLLSA